MMNYSLHGKGKLVKKVLITGFILIGLLLLVSAVVVRRAYVENLKPVSSAQLAHTVEVPIGASVKEVAAMLKEKNVIREAWAFEWYVRNNGLRERVQAGTYSIRPNQGIPEIVEIMTQGRVASELVTIIPGWSIGEIRTKFINSGYSEQQVDAALEPTQYENHPALVDKPRGANLEGYLYPESFQKTADTKLEDIITASLDEMQKQLTPDIRSGIVKQGLTVHQGVIIASIIEKEVDNVNDKNIVAQVFLKRLRQDIQLGSDVTAVYGALVDGKEMTVGESISYDSKYNTRKYNGLPPGPISNVSLTSLAAIANPANTNYLFFVAGDDGKTYFSNTVEEHEALIKKHCIKLCSL